VFCRAEDKLEREFKFARDLDAGTAPGPFFHDTKTQRNNKNSLTFVLNKKEFLILLLNNTSIRIFIPSIGIKNTTGRFFIPPVIFSNNIVVFD